MYVQLIYTNKYKAIEEQTYMGRAPSNLSNRIYYILNYKSTFHTIFEVKYNENVLLSKQFTLNKSTHNSSFEFTLNVILCVCFII